MYTGNTAVTKKDIGSVPSRSSRSSRREKQRGGGKRGKTVKLGVLKNDSTWCLSPESLEQLTV